MKPCHWLAVVAALAVPAFAQDAAPAAAPGAKEGAAPPREAPPRKRRLKFKSDKPCTCASALGEADIEAAESRASAEQQPRRSEK